MAVIDEKTPNQLAAETLPNLSKDKRQIIKDKKNAAAASTLQALTSAALLLPGLLLSSARAANNDSVDIQYSHHQEGKRELFDVPNNRNPIEVDTFHIGSHISLADRVKFAFTYIQDTWSGATPVTTSPLVAGGNHPVQVNSAEGITTVGASPIVNSRISLSRDLKPLKRDQLSGEILGEESQLVHVLSSASPETRKQGDFTLTYEWDEVALDVGGGLSLENDYESYYGNIGGRWDLNQKLTTLKWGISYTGSETHAIIDHDAAPYITKTAFAEQIEFRGGSEIVHGDKDDWSASFGVTQILNKTALSDINFSYTHSTGYMENPYKAMTVVFVDPASLASNDDTPINGDVRALLEQRPNNRNQFSFSGKYVQYIAPLDAALHLSYQFSHDDWGINAHTFEAEWVQPLGQGWTVTPRVRYYSQSSADFYQSYLLSRQSFNRIALDAMGREIWVDANAPDNGVEYFRDEYFNLVDASGQLVDESLLNLRNKTIPFDPQNLPSNFSSDHRLSGYGALSGGISIAKQFAKGVALEAGFEYYQHAGSLKLGGGGENGYADFDYFAANAALSINLDALSSSQAYSHHEHNDHHRHHHSHIAPAGVMYSHMLSAADEWMFGYRFMYGRRAGDVLHGTDSVSDQAIVNNACSPTQQCRFIQPYMEMSMHMVNIMYAPTDWLNVMLMPQFVSMEMNLRELEGRPPPVEGVHEHTGIAGHTTGGIGDTVIASLIKLYDRHGHHLHLGLGFNAPTGDIELEFRRVAREDGGLVHFGMQLGSGTWDFLPSLTYSGEWKQWSWGAQVRAAVRMEARNDSGYRLGNFLQSTAWSSYRLTNWLSASLRGVYTVQDAIKGDFNKLNSRVGPMDYPTNYGGRYWDLGLGVNVSIPDGTFSGNSLSFEWLQPLQDDVNGYQIERDGALTASWRYVF